MSGFSVYKRGKFYYARIKSPITGNYLTAKSTGTEDKQRAEFIAQKWIYEGLPEVSNRSINESINVEKILSDLKSIQDLNTSDVRKFINYFTTKGFFLDGKITSISEITLIDYLCNFWDYANSSYIRDKKLRGHSISIGYCEDMTRWIKRYWEPYFNGLSLCDLTRQSLLDFSIFLTTIKKVSRNGVELDETLSFQSINHILKAGTVPLKWAADNGEIKDNPAANLMKFSNQHKKRGILTEDEISRLFSIPWDNPACRLGSYLAYQTGMRGGEILALRVRDILEDRIHVIHSFSKTDGLKSTKNGEERFIPIMEGTRKEIINYAKLNTNGFNPDSFIFFQTNTPDRPMREETLLSHLKKALCKIGIDKDEQTARGLCFHSWRHSYSKMMAGVLSERAMKLTGHKSSSVFEVYADHADESDFNKAKEATAAVFGDIVPFSQEVAQ